MTAEEETLPPSPPPPPPRQKLLGLERAPDAHLWARKWSTWLAAAAALLGAYCGGNLAAFALAPEKAQAAISAAELAWYARGTMISAGIAALVPLATSIRQNGLKR